MRFDELTRRAYEAYRVEYNDGLPDEDHISDWRELAKFRDAAAWRVAVLHVLAIVGTEIDVKTP